MRGDEFVGTLFTTPKQLRHLAEEHFGELFVPTELLAESPTAAVLALRLPGARLVVRAERAAPRGPFRVTSLERDLGERRIA